MQHAILCYAASDWELASELAAYLELNCPAIAFDLEEFSSPERLLNAAERALSADFPILLLSPSAVPQPFPRSVWQPILIDEAARFERQIAYVLLRPCKFPEVFRRGSFFDASQDSRAASRALKRWLLRHSAFFQTVVDLPELPAEAVSHRAALDHLEAWLCDRPGLETVACRETALAFAQAVVLDFEGVLWLRCARRSPAGLAGDAAHALGMRLRGPLEENMRALREVCLRRRILLVFEHGAAEDVSWAEPGAKASFLFVPGLAPPSPLSLEETAALFARWQADPSPCFRKLGDAGYHLCRLHEYQGSEWQSALSLGSAVCSLLKHSGRLAEAYESLEAITAALHEKDLPFEAARCNWEKSWILEEWGRAVPEPPRLEPAAAAVQLSLFE